jgi:hypothetical protein
MEKIPRKAQKKSNVDGSEVLTCSQNKERSMTIISCMEIIQKLVILVLANTGRRSTNLNLKVILYHAKRLDR